MATEAITQIPPETPLTQTTPRGLATASFCLGLWGSLTFWWYPFGMWVGIIAIVLGSLATVLRWRANSNGDNLAQVGVVLGSIAVGGAYTSYRVMQVFFEQATPTWP